jgi:hypothetical protein
MMPPMRWTGREGVNLCPTIGAFAPDRSNQSFAKPFCQGEPCAMGLSRIPIVLSRRVKAAP